MNQNKTMGEIIMNANPGKIPIIVYNHGAKINWFDDGKKILVDKDMSVAVLRREIMKMIMIKNFNISYDAGIILFINYNGWSMINPYITMEEIFNNNIGHIRRDDYIMKIYLSIESVFG